MPTKRTHRARNQKQRITPEAVAAFRAGDYGRLHNALGLKPWEESPLWVGDKCPDYVRPDDWQNAKRLRDELERGE